MGNMSGGEKLVLGLIGFAIILTIGITGGCMWDRYQDRLVHQAAFEKGYELGMAPGYPRPVWRKAGEK